MSGNWNPIAPKSKNNWKIFMKARQPAGKYQSYYNRDVVIVTKSGDFLIPLTTLKKMGDPEAIGIASNGNGLIGFIPMAVEDVTAAYKLEKKRSHFGRASAKIIAKSLNLIDPNGRDRIYSAILDDDNVLAVNLAQVPSVLGV